MAKIQAQESLGLQGHYTAVVAYYNEELREAKSWHEEVAPEWIYADVNVLILDENDIPLQDNRGLDRIVYVNGYGTIGPVIDGELDQNSAKKWIKKSLQYSLLAACGIEPTEIVDTETETKSTVWSWDASDLIGCRVEVELTREGEFTNIRWGDIVESNVHDAGTRWDGWENWADDHSELLARWDGDFSVNDEDEDEF